MATIAEMKSEIMELLQVKERFFKARIIRMRIGVVCPRCGGSGKFSYCEAYGDTCFECGGVGQSTPTKRSEWENTLEMARKAAESGRVSEYLDGLRAISQAKNATDVVMRAWEESGIKAKYDWMKAADGHPEHRYYADLNSRMCAAYEETDKAAQRLRFLGKKVGEEERVERAKELIKVRDWALQEIKEVSEAPEYRG